MLKLSSPLLIITNRPIGKEGHKGTQAGRQQLDSFEVISRSARRQCGDKRLEAHNQVRHGTLGKDGCLYAVLIDVHVLFWSPGQGTQESAVMRVAQPLPECVEVPQFRIGQDGGGTHLVDHFACIPFRVIEGELHRGLGETAHLDEDSRCPSRGKDREPQGPTTEPRFGRRVAVWQGPGSLPNPSVKRAGERCYRVQRRRHRGVTLPNTLGPLAPVAPGKFPGLPSNV